MDGLQKLIEIDRFNQRTKIVCERFADFKWTIHKRITQYQAIWPRLNHIQGVLIAVHRLYTRDAGTQNTSEQCMFADPKIMH